MNRYAWNRCDRCGRFIALRDFNNGASRRLVTPDTAFTAEEYETFCIACMQKKLDRVCKQMNLAKAPTFPA